MSGVTEEDFDRFQRHPLVASVFFPFGVARIRGYRGELDLLQPDGKRVTRVMERHDFNMRSYLFNFCRQHIVCQHPQSGKNVTWLEVWRALVFGLIAVPADQIVVELCHNHRVKNCCGDEVFYTTDKKSRKWAVVRNKLGVMVNEAAKFITWAKL